MDITAIPGLIVTFVLYLFDIIFLNPSTLPIILAATAPLALGALCGVMCERSGVVNIGIEGIMLTTAFVGYLTGFLLHESIGTGPALVLGIVMAVLVGALLGVVHGWLTISIRADQIIAGVFLNVAAVAFTGYFNRIIITPTGRGGAGVLETINLVPPEITTIPVIGPILAMFLNANPIAMSVIVFVIGLHFLLYRTRWGLRTRAVGEHPKAVDTVGIDVIRLRYLNVIVGCALAGLAGAYIVIGQNGAFQNEMSAGRGFIALAAVIFGRWTPLGAFGGALLFGAASSLQTIISVARPEGQLGSILVSIPTQFYAAFPYVLTIIVLAGVVGRSIPPAADGIPYAKEARA
ncbi:MAG TPA: ABC transporter permease [Candidatus Limnocylindrales bacterium]|jgi:simple sugar transport system permease protein